MITKKEWLKKVHGIGNGKARGRISKEGHALIAKAISEGMKFADSTSQSADKPTITEEYSPADVRKWATKKGIKVGARGRIDAAIVRQYLDDVPKDERAEREETYHGKDLREAAPRTYDEGTTFIVSFTDTKGNPRTMEVNDKTACMKCRVSLSGCRCAIPGPVAIGFEDTTKEVTVRAKYIN